MAAPVRNTGAGPVHVVERVTILSGTGPWQHSGSWLSVYLAQHPGRLRDLVDLVPDAVEGLGASWSLRNGVLFLDHLALLSGPDELAEMLLWRALFPGLSSGIPGWWIDGRYELHMAEGHGRQLLCAQKGEVLYFGDPFPAARHWWRSEFHEWPFPARMAILPVLLVLMPLAMVVIFRGDKRVNQRHWGTMLLYAGLTMLLFPIQFLFQDRITPYVQPLFRPLREREELRGMLQEALPGTK
jgi:hypothetical protein